MSSTCARILNANRHLVWSLCKCAHSCWSLENPGAKVYTAFIVNRITDLDGITANLTILDIRLAAHRRVQHHRDPFPAVRAGEEVFHEWPPGGLGGRFLLVSPRKDAEPSYLVRHRYLSSLRGRNITDTFFLVCSNL